MSGALAESRQPPVRVPVALIVRVVASQWGIDRHVLLSGRREGRLVDARRVVYLLAREQTALTTSAIGRLLGNREHSTIKHGLDSGHRLVAADPAFAARVAEAREAVIALAATTEGARYRDADAVAAAEKIMRNPNREALGISVDAIVAMADRVLALEEIAATAYRLLSTVDAMERAQRPLPNPPPAQVGPNTGTPVFGAGEGVERRAAEEAAALADSARALTDTLAGALAALGYAVEEETDDEKTEAAALCAE